MDLDRSSLVDGTALVAPLGALWLVDHGYAATVLDMLSSMTMADVATVHRQTRDMVAAGPVMYDDENDRDPEDRPRKKPYKVQDGVAYMGISGPMTKNLNSMAAMLGGTSTKMAVEALKAAAADKSVKSVMFVMDTPGGTVDGTFDLAEAVRLIGRQKPIDGYAEDNCCSAGYVVLSQMRNVWANQNAVVGSIGVYTMLTDLTGRDKQQGIKRHVVYSGKHKAIGVPGREVTDEHLAKMQEKVDAMMALFVKFVAKGRGLSESQLARVATGDTWVGMQAKRVGLIDDVKTIEAAHQAAVQQKGAKRMAAAPATVAGAGTTEQSANAAANNVTDADIDEVRAWLAAADPQQPLNVTVTQIASTATQLQEHPLLVALRGVGVTDAAGLDALVARAAMGDQHLAQTRKFAKQLAVVALGPEAGAQAAATIDVQDIGVVRAMALQYESIAVAKGLVPPPGGAPAARGSAAGGHREVGTLGTSGAQADTTGGAKPTPQQLAEVHLAERRASGMYHM